MQEWFLPVISIFTAPKLPITPQKQASGTFMKHCGAPDALF
jgi:hypothetical protein